jgi:predicted ATPase
MPDVPTVAVPAQRRVIRTPDQRLRVFVSSTLGELAEERQAVRDAITRLRLAPVMFEAGARPHPPRELYRAYLSQSHVFVGVYWERYGWVAPGETVSGLEDEYALSGERPKLIYVKTPAAGREPRLRELLDRVKADDRVSYRPFGSAAELADLVADDLAVLLSETFEVGRPAEPAEEEAARVASPPLPVPPTPLVGRERDVDRVRALLARPDVRVVTVSGAGGMGKSRVALAVAESAAREGMTVAWAGLSDVAEPGLAAAALLPALGLREQPTRTAEATVAEAIGDDALLVVLDGAERVLDAVAPLTILLYGCRNVRVLVTSRSALAVRAEHEYPLGPLDVPPETARPTLATFELSGAGRLFLDVANATAPGWRPAEHDAAALADVCRALDGVPLAIELAAARIKVFSPSMLRDRLADRLAVLTGGARDLPRRHQTLRATLDWDHDLLTADEQALFRRLGVCSGGFTLELAEALGAGSCQDPLDVVASLVAKSLIRHVGGDGGEPRFAMLAVVRDYALDRLRAAGEEAAVQRGFAAWLVAFTEAASPFGTEQVRWIDAFESERRNVLAALQQARDAGDDDTLLRLCAGIAPLWEVHGHLAEGAHWLDHALARTAGVVSPARAEALAVAAHLARARLDFDTARALLDEALRIGEELGDPRRRARRLKDLGIVAGESDDHETARAFFRKAITGFRSVGDRLGEAQALNNLALSTESSGDVRGSLAMYAEALPVLREIGDMLSVARLLNNVGGALERLGSHDLARDTMLRALARYRRLASRWDLTDSLEHLAPAILAAGDAPLAARLLGAAEALREQLGAPAAPYLDRTRSANAAAVREALGASAFDAEWENGRRMAWDAAAAAALSVAPPALIDLDDATVDADLERRIAAEVG